jgi:hypothetical protein
VSSQFSFLNYCTENSLVDGSWITFESALARVQHSSKDASRAKRSGGSRGGWGLEDARKDGGCPWKGWRGNNPPPQIKAKKAKPKTGNLITCQLLCAENAGWRRVRRRRWGIQFAEDHISGKYINTYSGDVEEQMDGRSWRLSVGREGVLGGRASSTAAPGAELERPLKPLTTYGECKTFCADLMGLLPQHFFLRPSSSTWNGKRHHLLFLHSPVQRFWIL